MASSASDQGAGRRIRPLSAFTSGSGQSSHAPPPRTHSQPPQPCLFPPLLRTGGARPSALTASAWAASSRSSSASASRPAALTGPKPMVRAPAPLFCFFVFPLVGPAFCVSARLYFFQFCNLSTFSKVSSFYRKNLLFHAYNNSSSMHRIKMIYI